MKNWSFLIFFGIVLFIYSVINYYILKRGLQALSDSGIYRTIFLYSFLFLILSFPLGRIIEQIFRNSLTDFLVIVGSFYLGIMVYGLLCVVLIDVLRLVDDFISFFPAFITRNPQKSAAYTVLAVLLITFGTVLAGHVNTLFPRVRSLEIDVIKPSAPLKQLKLVMVSDIHLGTIIQNGRLLQIVDMINELKPDVVMLPGDIVDEDVSPAMEKFMAKTFQNLQSRFGTFAITGNHEYFSGVTQAVRFMEKGNIRVLQDEAVKVADAFFIVGRKDRMAERMAGGRLRLETIMQSVDPSLPVILLDHQPYQLEEAQENGIDLQLSGHTHHGQLFPFHLITRLVYELSWGYLKKGETHYYVSCGVGTWGPPLRTNSVPEIVQITLRFKEG